MKYFIFPLLVLMFCFACKHKIDVKPNVVVTPVVPTPLPPTKYKFIIAGDSTSDGVKYSKLRNGSFADSIDFDKDGTKDLIIDDYHLGGVSHAYTSYSIKTINKNDQIFIDTNAIGYIRKHNFGDTINDSLIFRNIKAKTNYLYTGSWTAGNPSKEYGEWGSATDKYLIFKFIKKDGTTYYGWVRMDINYTITVKDYAFRQ